MKLSISRCAVDEAAAFLEERLSARTDTSGGLQTVAQKIAGCQCFRVNDEAGALVGYYALSVIDRANGSEVVVAAVAGRIRRGDLVFSLMPFIERQAQGARALIAHTRRRGLVAKLYALGWRFDGYVPAGVGVIMRKTLAPISKCLDRRALYRAGLPLGEGATRARIGGGYVCGEGGGGGSSSSAQTQETYNTDMRVVGGDASTNVSAQNSTVNVTDAGAIHAAFGFADHVLQGAYDNAIASQQASADIVTKSEAAVADAYSTAKAGEQKVLVGAALAIVGVVAFAAVKK